ncbi:hypothetical protein P2318_02195 [Myxococcaceae bacterium GXIMD 01537]
MVKNISAAMALVVGLAVAGSASAAEAEADKRQVRQQVRINQGVRSGELTGREAVRLQAQHNAIQRDIARGRADDGKLDAAERARIDAKQDKLNKRIARQKHDAQQR